MDKNWLFGKVKDFCQCETIHFQNNAFIFVGRKFRSFHLNHSVFSCYPEIHPVAWKCAFLPDDRLLVDGGADGMYHLLSLKDGKRIESWKAPGNRTMRSNCFAVSPDGNYVFDYWKVKKQYHIVRFDLVSLEYKTIPIRTDLRVVQDIVCVSKDHVILLLYQAEIENNNKNDILSQLVSINLSDSGYFPIRLYSWKSSSKCLPYSTDGRYVLYDNLCVYDLRKNNVFSLLENTKVPSILKANYARMYYNVDSGFLQLCNGKINEFIDCKNRKLVARYYTPECSFAGCIVNDEFWIPGESGIQRKNFPMIETR